MKLKEKINKKPKLKLLLKRLVMVLLVGYAIFGVIISGFLIASCSSQRLEDYTNEVHKEATKPIQNYHDYNGMLYTFSVRGDLTDYSVFEVIKTYNPTWFANTTKNDGVYIDISDFSCNICDWSYISYEGDDYITFDNAHTIRLNRLRVYYLSKTSYANGLVTYRYRIEFMKDNTSYITIRLNDYFGNDMSPSYVALFEEPLEVTGYGYFVQVNRYDDVNAFNILTGAEENDYFGGYNAGYQNGWNVGYSQGMTDGVLVGETHLANDPFELIKNSFNSIAGILDIQLLPHFTLGMLVFIPLIFAILIVIVKTIRG